MINIMLDLETMGTMPNSAIVAIGAVKFSLEEGIGDKFYEVITLDSSMKKGFDVEASTIKWWMRQSDDARKEIFGKGMAVKDTLIKFQEYMGKNTSNIQMWGNGSDFDNVILGNAFRAYGVTAPWPYHGNRCFRTIKSSFDKLDVANLGTAHNALHDAEYQATYLTALVKKHNLSNML